MVQSLRRALSLALALVAMCAAAPAQAANKPPKALGTFPPAYGTEGVQFTYIAPAFYDPEGTAVTYRASNVPTWLTFDPTQRRFSGIPPFTVAATGKTQKVKFTFTAADASGKAKNKTITLKVADAPEPAQPQLLVPLADLKLDEDVPYWFTVPTGTFSNPAGGSLTYQFSGLPPGAEVPPPESNPSGFGFNYGPPQAAVGTHTVTVTVTDRLGRSASDNFNVTVSNKNDAPLASDDALTLPVIEDEPFSTILAANLFTDEDGDVLSYDIGVGSDWATYDGTTRELRGMVREATLNPSIWIFARDPSGATSSYRIGLDVTPVNDPPVVVHPAPDLLVNAGDTFNVNASFRDEDDAHLTIAILGAPAWAAVDDHSIMGAPGPNDGGSWTITFTATDPHGLTASDEFVLTVLANNHAPVLSKPFHPVSGIKGEAYSYAFPANAFTDPDGDTLTFELTSAPAWLALDSATRTLSGTPPVDGATWANLTIRATDIHGARVSYTTGFELRPSADTPPTTYSVRGRMLAQRGALVDVDTNDPYSPRGFNDQPYQAQSVGFTPAVVAGFASSVGTGRTGDRFQTSADPFDSFRVSLLAGTAVYLQISDHVGYPSSGTDLDLYLEDADTLELVAWSAGFGPGEYLVAPRNGVFNVVVHGYNGWSNYVLNVGGVSGAAVESFKAITSQDAFVPGEAIVRSRSATNQKAGVVRTAPPSPRLVALNGVSGAGKPGDPSLGEWRGGRISDRALRERLETVRAAKRLALDPTVAGVDLNYIRTPAAAPSDPLFHVQWHYRSIHLAEAWQTTRGASTVVVAVIDTGVMLAHPDLAANLVAGYDFISSASRSRDGDGIDANPDDPGDSDLLATSSFHGTHVAGTIGAVADNGVGGTGVAPGVRIMPLRVLGVGGGTSYDIIQAVRFAAGLSNDSGTTPVRRADVINLSLGGGSYSGAEQETYAATRAAGTIVIAAAGNSASATPSYPAAYDGVVSVAATDLRGDAAPYSNHGATIDVAAPGGDLTVDADRDGSGDGVLSTHVISNGTTRVANYSYLQGTSMASPHVAGVAALMRAVHPGLTPSQFDGELRNGRLTDDLGNDGAIVRNNRFGYGLINAEKAVSRAQSLATGVEAPTLVRVNPAVLAVPPAIAEAAVQVERDGSALARLTAVSVSDPRITVAPFGVDALGFGGYRVGIDRTGLASGVHEFTIDFTTDIAGSARVQVLVEVADAVTFAFDNGLHYVLLVDTETFTVVAGDAVVAVDSVYEYQIDDVPPGTYLLFAGTDHDNDYYVCDPGESCAGYPQLTLLEPLQVVDQDVELPDIVTGVLQAVGTNSSSPAVESRTPTGLLRVPEVRW